MAEGYVGGRPYAPSPVPYDAKDLPRYLSAELARISNILADFGAVRWGGRWALGDCFEKNTMVIDTQWTMISNKDTCERAAPQPSGTPVWVLPDAPSWAPAQSSSETLSTGARYTFPSGVFVRSVRAWLPVADPNVFYRLVYTFTEGEGLGRQVHTDWFNALDVGWSVRGVATIPVGPGVVLDIELQTQNRSGSASEIAPYDYDTPNKQTTPGSGQIVHANKAVEVMRVHKIDNDSVDQSVMLSGIQNGDHIQGVGQDWSVTSTTDSGAYYEFGVMPAAQGSPDGVADFVFVQYDLQVSEYVVLGNEYADPSNVKGVLQKALTDDAYGIDIEWQEADISEDWDIVSAP